MKASAPHEERGFDPEPSVRRAARALYEETRGLPIISPHGHVDPRLLAENQPFADPVSLIVTPDHYVVRMLYAHGVSLESLGVPTREDAVVETDPRAIWQRFAEHRYLFQATPTGFWLDHELHEVFGVRERLDGDTGGLVYDEIAEKLAAPEYLPRALFDRFAIEVLATTDPANDGLEHHRAIRRSGWNGNVIPTFRPDALFRIAAPGWSAELAAMGRVCDTTLADYEAFVRALRQRRAYFRDAGATATDHGLL